MVTIRRLGAAWGLLSLLAGCSGPIGLYHDVEGGAIARNRQPPPGASQPYPNLANVPLAPGATPAGTEQKITAQAKGQSGVSPPSPGALAGLTLPASAPPPPDVPGLAIPATAPAKPAPVAPPAPAAKKPNPPPIPIAFPPGTAILPPDQNTAIAAIAAKRDGATLLAGGFGDGSLPLALARAQRVAAALTAAGVPAKSVQLSAMAAGSGGFVQLVY